MFVYVSFNWVGCKSALWAAIRTVVGHQTKPDCCSLQSGLSRSLETFRPQNPKDTKDPKGLRTFGPRP
eukprot:5629476-Amphidinium_carterae.1